MKTLKIIFLSVISLFSVILFILAVNADLRRDVLERVILVYTIHQEAVVRTLVKEKRYNDVSNRILQYINLSRKVSSGRSQFFPKIVGATEFAAERAINNKELLALRPVFTELLKIDPNLYHIRIWLAKSIKDLDYQASISNIEEAIKLSEVDEAAYRAGIEIAKNNNQKLAQKYCSRYMNAQLGGQYPKSFYFGYAGEGLREFSVRFNNEELFYSHTGIKLGKTRDYEFIIKKPFDFNELTMFSNIVSGTKITINQISLFTENDVKTINASNFMTTTRSAYDVSGTSNNSDDKLILISMGDNTEVINMYLDTPIVDVKKIIIKMMFSRLPLASRTKLCN